MPFFERFRWCLQLNDYDLSSAADGAVTEWLDAMAQLPAAQLASPDAARFTAALLEHRSLDFFDFVPFTACQLHPQLEEHLSQQQ